MLRTSYKIKFLTAIMTLSMLLVNPVHAEAAQKILAFGDSLILGYDISPEDTFSAQLERSLKKQGYDITVINAGEGGETTSGGVMRLEGTLEQTKPDFVILELGGNDMLRTIAPEVTYNNLRKMMEILKEHKIPVLLAGRKVVPDMDKKFERIYSVIYKNLAQKYDAVYYPFFLEGILSNSNLFQEDKMHPNKTGVAVIVQNILPFVEKLIALTQPPRTFPE